MDNIECEVMGNIESDDKLRIEAELHYIKSQRKAIMNAKDKRK